VLPLHFDIDADGGPEENDAFAERELVIVGRHERSTEHAERAEGGLGAWVADRPDPDLVVVDLSAQGLECVSFFRGDALANVDADGPALRKHAGELAQIPGAELVDRGRATVQEYGRVLSDDELAVASGVEGMDLVVVYDDVGRTLGAGIEYRGGEVGKGDGKGKHLRKYVAPHVGRRVHVHQIAVCVHDGRKAHQLDRVRRDEGIRYPVELERIMVEARETAGVHDGEVSRDVDVRPDGEAILRDDRIVSPVAGWESLARGSEDV
jgi:hypothetical protein